MTLQLYLLRQLLISVSFALAGLGFLVLPAITVQAVHKLEGAGLEAVGSYVPLVLAELVPYLGPIAFLLGVVATFGRLAADNEWTAIRMAGVHPLRSLLPGLVLAALGAAGTHYLLATVAPEWKYAQRTFLRDSEMEAFKTLGQGRTQFSVGKFFVDASRRNGSEFYEVVLGVPLEGEDDEAEPETLIVVADAIKIDFPADKRVMEIFFQNARTLRDDQVLSMESPFLRLSLDDLVSKKRKNKDVPKYLTNETMTRRLAGDVMPGEETPVGEKRQLYRYEIQRRRALSCTYFLFLLLGTATGLMLRAGTQLSAMAVSIGYAFLYYVFSMRFGKGLVEAGLVPPEVAAWATNGLYLAVALVMVRKVLWR
ncbi:MAG: LptF/LptG family permease [Planctomycetota bacterium]